MKGNRVIPTAGLARDGSLSEGFRPQRWTSTRTEVSSSGIGTFRADAEFGRDQPYARLNGQLQNVKEGKHDSLIVSDLDGTLLRETIIRFQIIRKPSFIEFEARDQILCWRREGFSGGARKYARQLKSEHAIQACNGALIKEAEGKLIYGKPLLDGDLDEVFRLPTEKNLIFTATAKKIFNTKKILRIPVVLLSFDSGLPDDRFPMVEIDPMELIGKDAVYKVLARCEGEENRRSCNGCLTEIAGTSVTDSWYNSLRHLRRRSQQGCRHRPVCKGKRHQPFRDHVLRR